MRRWSWPTMGSYASLAVAGTGGTAGLGSAAWLGITAAIDGTVGLGAATRSHASDGPTDLDAAVAEVQGWLDEVESALSPYRADSDLCRWRSGEVPLPSCSPLLVEVIEAVGALEDLTEGGFHPYDRQGRFDPTGYVKGWAVERAVGILTGAGVRDVSLGVGGDIQMAGRADAGRPWRVAVTDPTDERRIVAVVEAWADGRPFAVATSGAAQRGDHIWAGLGGRPGAPIPAESLASITVVGPDLGRVDAFATAIWALTRTRPLAQAWSWLPDAWYAALAVTTTGSIRTTPGMAAHMAGAAA